MALCRTATNTTAGMSLDITATRTETLAESDGGDGKGDGKAREVVEIEFEGMRVDDLYPATMPDLFEGSSVLVAGRYRATGDRGTTTPWAYDRSVKVEPALA